jgi:hypothetical protein
MKCDEARAGYLAGEPARDHADHLASCQACLSITSELRAMREMLSEGALWQQPDPTSEETVVSLIGGAARLDDASASKRMPRRRTAVAVAAVVIMVAGITAAVVAITRAAGPDWEVAVPGTSAAPGALATARGWVEPGGTRLELDITGLGPAPPESVYEVWFSRGAIHISAGTFATTDDTIEMWTGIARRDFPRIWVTVEPFDTDEGPSLTTVLDTG